MPQKKTPRSLQASGNVSRNMLLAQTISVENVKGMRGKDSHTVLSHALMDSGTLILARRYSRMENALEAIPGIAPTTYSKRHRESKSNTSA